MTLAQKTLALLLLVIGSIGIGLLFFSNIRPSYASTPVASEYYSTTTVATGAPSIRLIKTGVGTFGSVVITGAQVGTIDVYNATTSDVTQRTGQTATSSILLAQFPASAPAGTYTFDTVFTVGLLIVTSASPTAPTSTITYR